MIKLLAVIVGVFFVVTFVWYAYYQVVYGLVSVLGDVAGNNTSAQTVSILLQNVWNWFPVIMLILLLIYAVVYIQREEARSRYEGYY